MKKLITSILICLLAVMLVISLTACGGNENKETNKPSTQTTAEDDSPLVRPDTTTAPDTTTTSDKVDLPDFASILAGNGDTNHVWGKEDPAVRQQIIDEGKTQGLDISFGNDGSMTIKDQEGGTFVQSNDGSWTYTDDSGHTSQYGGEWPENKFTKLVPKPDFDLIGASSDDYSFSVGFSSVTVQQIKAYAEKLKAAGFNIDVNEDEQNAYGVQMYEFTAANSAGYTVDLVFVSNVSSITISEPD